MNAIGTRRLPATAVILLAAVAAPGCDRPPASSTAYNNSGYTVSGEPTPDTQRALREESNPPAPNIVAREIPPTNTDPPAQPSPSQNGTR